MFLLVFNTGIFCMFVGGVLGLLSFFNFQYIFFVQRSIQYINLTFFFDYISFQFLGVLLVIVGSVVIFSLLYMEKEIIRYSGFIWVLYLFVLSMIFLIIRGDWLVLILGWDWLGVRSFFLVAFYNRDSSWSGSLKTYFTKRLGDGFFLILLRIILLENSFFISWTGSFFLIIIVILLTQTKRAQLPFRAWLPAAMAAPTPVSALVHSSTLVTAGIYIVIRLSSSLKYLNYYICFVGLLTLFIGSIRACGRMDMKKIVAFSTLRHLGFMFVCLSSGIRLLGFFHLVVHASFKALLFICVGSLIVLKNHSQDLRQVRFNQKKYFFIWGALVRVVRLCGFPYFAGFFSKDFIIEFFFWNYNISFFILFLSSLILTVIYRSRLIKRFLNTHWSVGDYSLLNFYYWYFYPLLFFTVVLGATNRYYCVTFFLVGGTCNLKIIIYRLLILGLILIINQRSFFPFLASSIRFLDSLGPGVTYLTKRASNFHQYIDLGMLPLIREYQTTNFQHIFRKFWNYLGQNLFYYVFLFIIIIFFF